MNDAVRQWWRHTEGWIALAVLSIGMFGIGWSLGVVSQVDALQTAHRETLEAKDKLIERLAASAATASAAASAATESSAAAVSAASDAAAQMSAAAEKADAAAGKTTKNLKGLK